MTIVSLTLDNNGESAAEPLLHSMVIGDEFNEQEFSHSVFASSEEIGGTLLFS